MLKLCYICSGYVIGGFEKMVYDLCLKLDSGRFDTTICLLQSKGKFIDLMVEAFPRQVHLFNLSFPVNSFRLMQFLRRGHFDVIHAFGLKGDLMTRMMKLAGFRTALITSIANPDLPNSRLKALTNQISSSLADSFWADCRFRASAGVERSNIPKEKIQVIYPGLDADFLRHHFDDGKSVKQELRIESDAPVVGSVGDLRFIKGHHIIIQAAPLILRDFPNTVFVFVGADSTNGELFRSAQRSGLSDHFRFVGFRSDAVRFISAMDVVLQPSLTEGLPRAILEAMSLSKPVIGSSVGGIPEIIQDEVNGYVIPPNDAQTLAERTCKVLANPVLRMQLGEAAYETVMENFSIQRMIRDFENFYSGLVPK